MSARRGALLAFAVFAVATLVFPALAAETRGLAVVEVRDRAGAQVALYEESHALVIGVSDYTGGWPRLRGVKKDVPLVKAALESQGFSVTVVMDPDRDGIDRAFRDFIERYGDTANNRLLFYFAGHGHTMRLAYGGDMGYLVGRDAPNPNVDKRGFKQAALSMQVIETYARNIEAKHALFMFDACFSGSVFDATRAIPAVIREKTGKPVRQFITSGTADQEVPDESIFRGQFVAALEGEGDLDGDGYITGAELGQFLETTVTNYTNRAQTPQYGKLRDPLLDKGDFVFALAGAAPSPPSPTARPAAGADKEALFWASIEDSDDAAAFEEFLKQFPAGTFAGLARLRLKRLKAARTAALPPPAVEVEDLDATFVALKTANLRAAPSAEAARVGRLAKDSAVAVTGKVRGRPWYRIAHAGRTAYVHAALVAAVDAAEVTAWARVKDSRRASDLEAFLRRFPRGHFAGRARRLAAALKPRLAMVTPPKPALSSPAKPAVGIYPKAPARRIIAIGTGGPTGVYFPTGNAICREVHKEAAEGRRKGRKHGIRCSAPSTGGSVFNISNIKAGELDFGMAQSDWQFHAYNGSSKFKGKAFRKLRAVFSVHPEAFHIVVGRHSGIRTWNDLAGKRVNIGNPGSGQRWMMEWLMQAHGTTRRDFQLAAELTSTEQSRALCDGKIDAYGYIVGVPNAGVAATTDGCGARIIDLNGPVERRLVAANPYLAFATIPKGTYRTSDADVTTFGVMATLVTSADVPDAVVYEVVRAVMENIADFREQHPAFRRLDPRRMIRDGLSAPLHRGAVRYYKEKGWM